MKLTHKDFQGYGVYEFSGSKGVGQMPSLALPSNLPDPSAWVKSEGGIQVVDGIYRDMVMMLLDQTNFDPDDDPNAPMVTGQANAILGTLGSGWANDYLEKGYAIMGEIASAKTGAPIVMMANAPGYIADNARTGGPYALIKAPPALLAEAQALVSTPGPGPGPGVPVVPPGGNGGGNGVQPAKADTKLDKWVLPAAVAVGGLALVAFAVSRSS